MIRSWYTDFTTYEGLPVDAFAKASGFTRVQPQAAAEEQAAALALGDLQAGAACARGGGVSPGGGEDAAPFAGSGFSGEDDAKRDGAKAQLASSAQRCKGMFKTQCLLLDVCFALVSGRVRLQYYYENLNSDVMADDTHERMQAYAEATSMALSPVESTRVVLGRALRGASVLDSQPHGPEDDALGVDVLYGAHLPIRRSRLGRGSAAWNGCGEGEVAILIRGDALHVGGHTLLSDVMSAFSNMLDLDTLVPDPLLLLPPRRLFAQGPDGMPQDSMGGVLKLLSSRPPLALDAFIERGGAGLGAGGRAERQRCVSRLIIGLADSAYDSVRLLRFRRELGPYLSAMSCWVRVRHRAHIEEDAAKRGALLAAFAAHAPRCMGPGGKEGEGREAWEIGVQDLEAVHVLVAQDRDVGGIVGSDVLVSRLRRSHPSVIVDLDRSWEYGDLRSIERGLHDAAVFVSGCGEAVLASLFLRKGAHVIIVPTLWRQGRPLNHRANGRPGGAEGRGCVEALVILQQWAHLHVHVADTDPMPARPATSDAIKSDGGVSAMVDQGDAEVTPFGVELSWLQAYVEEGEFGEKSLATPQQVTDDQSAFESIYLSTSLSIYIINMCVCVCIMYYIHAGIHTYTTCRSNGEINYNDILLHFIHLATAEIEASRHNCDYFFEWCIA